MEQLYDKYLPIGTVVLLKGGTKRLMIIGFCAKPVGEETEYDYTGCLYPEGIISTDNVALFNHEQIEQVYNVAYTDQEEMEFKKNLKELVSKVKENG